MLKVGFDLRPTEPGFKAHFGRGTGRYALELARHLGELSPEELGVEVVPIRSGALRGNGWQRALVERAPFGRGTLETQLVLPYALRAQHVHLMHFLAHGDAPAWSPIPYMVSVLDLIPLRFPELYRAHRPNWRYRFARHLELQAIRSAGGIIAISEATRRDVVELLGVSPDKIAVTPLAVGKNFRPLSSREAVRETEVRALRKRLGLPVDRPVLLYVGGIDPRKNVPFLLEVFRGVVSDLPPDRRPVLALAGSYEHDENFPAVLEAITRLNLSESVVLLGRVSDEDLVAAYQSSDLFLFPSLYEGFGFPVLEAFACGLPVVAGNNSSIPEVAANGGASLLPDNDHEAWIREILLLLGAPLAKRLELGKQGILRAREFSWERTARLTLAAYRAFGERFGRSVQERGPEHELHESGAKSE